MPLAMPVERSGQDEFDFEYGDDFGAHIEAFDPTFAKVLVRYNPDGDADLNRRQTAAAGAAQPLAAGSAAQVPVRAAGAADQGPARSIRRRPACVRPRTAAGPRRRDHRGPASWRSRARHLEDRGAGQPRGLRGGGRAGTVGRPRRRQVHRARPRRRRAAGNRVGQDRRRGGRFRRFRRRPDAVGRGADGLSGAEGDPGADRGQDRRAATGT